MPSGVTLESLNIEINANAKGASEGIKALTTSLSGLSEVVQRVLPGLREVRETLKGIKAFSNIKIPTVATAGARSATGAGRRATRASSAVTGAVRASVPPLVYRPDTPADKAKRRESFERDMAAIRAYNENRSPVGVRDETAILKGLIARHSPDMVSSMYAKLKTQSEKSFLAEMVNSTADRGLSAGLITEETAKAMKDAAAGITETGEAAEQAKPKVGGFGKLLGQIGKIAKTMIIRTAMRALMKSFTESWQAAYAFSERMGGSFAQSVDMAKSALSDTATTIVQTFAPVLQMLVPVLKIVTDAIQWLCQGLQWLLSLIGLTSDLVGVSVAKINKGLGSTTKSAKDATKATKGLLATWDELNIIQSTSGTSGSGSSGGSGSGYKAGSLKDMVGAELSGILQLMVGEGLLATGLILACTGHIGAGIGLIVVGASAVAKTLTTDWNALPNNVKKELAQITAVIGMTMFEVGLILACANHIAPGIAMMAMGAANFAGAMAVSWGSDMESGVREGVGKVMAIGGSLMFVAGLILALATPHKALGIGMMVSGGVSLASSIALNWDSIVESVNGVIKKISDWFVAKWELIEEAATLAWESVSKWWNENIVEPLHRVWDGLVSFFATIFADKDTEGSIAWYANNAFKTVSTWWNNSTIGRSVSEAWHSFSNFFKNLFAGKDHEGSIAYHANNAWTTVSTWWNENVTENVKKDGAWGGVKGFFEGIWGSKESGTGIAGLASAAWDEVKKWWENGIGDEMTRVWTDFKDKVDSIFQPVIKVLAKIWGIIENILNLNGKTVAINTEMTLNYPVITGSFGSNGTMKSTLTRMEKANGAYDIPKGDLFIANEAGAELVGSMNGKTTVANQGQIIEGIQAGVRDANSEQNGLLRQQNELLRRLIDKSWEIHPSADWGNFNQQSNAMWNRASGR